MTNSRLLVENFYFKQLLNEEVAFNEQYHSLFGDRTKEFFEYYCLGLSAQKQLVLELECQEITDRILQEKFGDQFAARMAGFGSKAQSLVGKLATGAGFGGKLGSWAQKKLGIPVDADGSVAYIKARNKNFTRSLGDYLGQLKTFDNTLPDKIGMVDVKKSGWLKGIAQKGGQILGGAGNITLAGLSIPTFALTGTVFAGVNGLQQLTNKLNEIFDAQWSKIQNTKPVQDFDRLFEEKKQAIRNKLSKLDKEGKETSKILQTVDSLSAYVKENPGKSGVVIALLVAVIGLGAGPLGLGVLTVTQLPILTGAVAFFLRTGLGLLQGEKASTAIGNALRTAVVGYLTGKVIGVLSNTVIKAVQMGMPPAIDANVLAKVNTLRGDTTNVVGIRFAKHVTVAPGFVGYDDFINVNRAPFIAMNASEFSKYAQLQSVYNARPNLDNASKLFRFLDVVANSQRTEDYLKGTAIFDAAIKAGKSAQEAAAAWNAEVANLAQGVAQGVAAGAGAGVAAASAKNAGQGNVGANKKPVTESFKLSDIAKSILLEADAAAPGAVPPVLPGQPGAQPGAQPAGGEAPVDPNALTPNQQEAVANLKKNIEKEIRGYIKDVAKTFKVKGKTTTELLDGLRKEPKAKSAVEIIDSIIGEFPKYKLEFPKDVVVDDKEAATPVSQVTTADPKDSAKDASDAANKEGAKPADVVSSVADAKPEIKKAAEDAAAKPGATAQDVAKAVQDTSGVKPGGGGGKSPEQIAKDANDAANKPNAKPADVVSTVPPTAAPEVKKAAEDAANKPGATPQSVAKAVSDAAGVPPTPAAGGGSGKTALTPNDLKMVKAFLTKVSDLSASVKSLDLNAPTKSKMRPVISNILDILDIATGKVNPSVKINKKLDSAFQGIDFTGQSIATPAAAPAASPAAPAAPATPVTEAEGEEPPMNLSPDVKKQFALIKSNPLISGDVVTRIVNLMKMNIGDPTNIKHAIGLVSAIKDSVGGAATKASIVKQLGGNIGELRRTMLAEDMKSSDIMTIMKEIKSLMSALVSLTFGLRQATSSKNKTNKEGVVLKAKIGAIVYVFKYTGGKWFARDKDKQFTNPVEDPKRIEQLNALAATGKNDAEQVKKDDEKASQGDKTEKGDEKDKDKEQGDSETKKTLDASTSTRATAKPNKGKDISKPGDKNIGFNKSKYEENFKSEYKNYF